MSSSTDAAFDVPTVRIMGGRCGVSWGTVCVLATIAPIAVFRTVGPSGFVPQGGTTSIRPCRWTWTTELSCSCRHFGAPSGGGDLVVVERPGEHLFQIAVSPQIGITKCAELPLRFFIEGNRFVSR